MSGSPHTGGVWFFMKEHLSGDTHLQGQGKSLKKSAPLRLGLGSAPQGPAALSGHCPTGWAQARKSDFNAFLNGTASAWWVRRQGTGAAAALASQGGSAVWGMLPGRCTLLPWQRWGGTERVWAWLWTLHRALPRDSDCALARLAPV